MWSTIVTETERYPLHPDDVKHPNNSKEIDVDLPRQKLQLERLPDHHTLEVTVTFRVRTDLHPTSVAQAVDDVIDFDTEKHGLYPTDIIVRALEAEEMGMFEDVPLV